MDFLPESWIRSLQRFVTFNNQHQYHRLAFSIIPHKNCLPLEGDVHYAQTALERAGFGEGKMKSAVRKCSESVSCVFDISRPQFPLTGRGVNRDKQALGQAKDVS